MIRETPSEPSKEELIALIAALRAENVALQARVTEHRVHECQCDACGTTTRGRFPDGVNAPVQYGSRIRSFVIYLLHYQLLPEERLAELMADLFGVKLVAATIARMSRTCAKRLRGFADTVRDLVAGAPVNHIDETGFRIGCQTALQHIGSPSL